MNENITIKFQGTSKPINLIKENYSELSESYKIDFEEKESFSSFDGGDGKGDYWNINLRINNSFSGFMEGFIIKKLYDWVLKDVLFDPLYKWLESFDLMDDVEPARDLTFQFDDITVIVAYSRNNHQQAVGMITLSLTKLVPWLNSIELGRLTTVVSPVGKMHSSWHFFIPGRNFKLNDYIKSWGLEYNNHGGNRCVLNVRKPLVIMERWS